MERLTYEKSRSRWDEGRCPTKYTSRHTFQEVVARLAAYEDTGLDPEEIPERMISLPPVCYKEDGDGCAYQTYDGMDEPIDECKECPLCYVDKQRHRKNPNDPLTSAALEAVRAERQRQDALWGDQGGCSLFEWMSILGGEYGELCEAVNETCFKNCAHPDRGGYENIIKEAVQVAAVALAIIETVYRRKPEGGEGVDR